MTETKLNPKDKIFVVRGSNLNTSGLNCLLDCIVIVCVLSIEILDQRRYPSAHRVPSDLGEGSSQEPQGSLLLD